MYLRAKMRIPREMSLSFTVGPSTTSFGSNTGCKTEMMFMTEQWCVMATEYLTSIEIGGRDDDIILTNDEEDEQ